MPSDPVLENPLTQHQRAAIDALAKDEHVIRAPIWLAQQASVPNDAVERAFASQDPEGFWREKAGLVEWILVGTIIGVVYRVERAPARP